MLNNGSVYEPSGNVPRLSMEYHGDGLIKTVSYGKPVGLPDPQKDTYYIVSSMVLSACPNRRDLVAPDTGSKDCVRDNGRIVSVPGFIQNDNTDMIKTINDCISLSHQEPNSLMLGKYDIPQEVKDHIGRLWSLSL